MMWIWWEITIWYQNIPVYSLFQAHTQPNQVEKVIVSASFISNNSFSFLPFSLSFIEFLFTVIVVVGGASSINNAWQYFTDRILRKKTTNSFYYSFGSRFSRIRNWELGRTVFLCMEFMIKYHEYHQLCKWNCDLIW